MFDYSELLGKIKSVYGTQEAFAKAMDMTLGLVNSRLNNKSEWSSPEMMKACDVLGVDYITHIPRYFFTLKKV